MTENDKENQEEQYHRDETTLQTNPSHTNDLFPTAVHLPDLLRFPVVATKVIRK